MEDEFDIIVLGGGMAGCGLASFLAGRARVLLLEKERHAGMHATGRSAALFSETYGDAPIRALSRASKPFLANPPPEFDLASPLKPRGCLYIATAEQQDRLLTSAEGPLMRGASRVIPAKEARGYCPILRGDYVALALWEEAAQDLDVDALLQAFQRRFRNLGGTFLVDREVRAIGRDQGRWRVATDTHEFKAGVVVNAAGAWADQVATLAGVKPLGIRPLRRTALLVDPPTGAEISAWPCVIDIDEEFYFKPDSGQLLLSPADESPVAPCDAQPEELDIAIAVDRVERATTLEVTRVRHKWAGLRSFAPDRCPVVGYDPRAEGFFWLAGQGGYGIQTAPALSEAAAALVLRETVPTLLSDQGVDMALLSPNRLALV